MKMKTFKTTFSTLTLLAVFYSITAIDDSNIMYTETTLSTTEDRDFRPVDCKEGECINPETSQCEVEVRCFADPCDVGPIQCQPGEICVANYCGGCHAQCIPRDENIGVVTVVKGS
mmetsp:Transcript_31154/g.66732  ORF Transcript_31154/g.66732 Transcript_31154/m.66732 type:complete len:116 (-) Transcript_31154:94-441(-)